MTRREGGDDLVRRIVHQAMRDEGATNKWLRCSKDPGTGPRCEDRRRINCVPSPRFRACRCSCPLRKSRTLLVWLCEQDIFTRRNHILPFLIKSRCKASISVLAAEFMCSIMIRDCGYSAKISQSLTLIFQPPSTLPTLPRPKTTSQRAYPSHPNVI